MSLPSSSVDFQVIDQPTASYFLDFENKRILRKTDGLEALCQAFQKALTTPRYKERIYSGQYGSELHKLIGKSLDYVKATIRLVLEDALSPDDRFLAVKSLQVTQVQNDTLEVQAEIATRLGDIALNHLIRN